MEDLDDFYEYARNPKVYNMMTGWKPHDCKQESKDALKSFIERNDAWAIVFKEIGKVIGQIRLYPDFNRGKFSERNSAKFINYALSEDYWGKGYMTETVNCVVEYAFDEMNVESLIAFHLTDNIGTRRIIEKCGFKYELHLKMELKTMTENTLQVFIILYLNLRYQNERSC